MNGDIGMIPVVKCALNSVAVWPIAGGLGGLGLPDPPGC